MQNQQKFEQQSLWGITSYYNPCGYKRRLHNYKIFRKYLEIPLVTVELSYNGHFELNAEDADILIQIHGTNVMWQKERLFNIALDAVPAKCSKVAWLDCDIIIDGKDWVNDTINKLDTYKIVQPYKKLHHLPPDIQFNGLLHDTLHAAELLLSEYSFAFIENSDTPPPTMEKGRRSGTAKLTQTGSRGVFWAARKEVLLEHRFYDAFIVGGGDTSMTFAAVGKHHFLTELCPMSLAHKKHYLSWAENFYKTINSSMSHIDCDVYHLWHGKFSNRQYFSRYDLLVKFDYDPDTDISLTDNKSFYWTNGKTAMHRSIEDYFLARKEDG